MSLELDAFELQSRMQAARQYGSLRYTAIRLNDSAGVESEYADIAAESIQLKPLGSNWQVVHRSNAILLLQYAFCGPTTKTATRAAATEAKSGKRVTM